MPRPRPERNALLGAMPGRASLIASETSVRCVELGAVEDVRREPPRRLPFEAGAHARAQQRVRVLVVLRLGEQQAGAHRVDRVVRLEEVREQRARDERRARREAQLAGAAEEVVVAPAREPAHLLLRVVADAEADLARGQLRHLERVVDLAFRALVFVQPDGREEAQGGELVAGVVELALPEGRALRERDLAPDDVLAHTLVPGDRDVAEHARRAALEAIGDVGQVLGEVDPRRLRHGHAREAVLPVVAAEVRDAGFVHLLREDLALLDRERRQELGLLLRRERLAPQLDVHAANVDGRALLDPDDRGDGEALGRQHDVVQNPRLEVAAVLVHPCDPLEVDPERDGIELRMPRARGRTRAGAW